MRAAVIGGGINGIMSAWALAQNKLDVDLFERGRLMGATSSASTKLLHGGLRYLEQGHFKLVRESLRERQWWMMEAPHLTKRLQIKIPVYEDDRRSAWMIRCGLTLYEWLAGQASLGSWQRCSLQEVMRSPDDLRTKGLRAVFAFYDGQMDDCALGLWAAEKAVAAGVRIHTDTAVDALSQDGSVQVAGQWHRYDWVVNVAGPWARHLLDISGIPARHDLDLVRGSHILLDCPSESAFLLQAPQDDRVCFVLPYQGKTLVGTTEVRQQLSDPICCSSEEMNYLLELYRHYFPSKEAKVCGVFSGLRPLVRSHRDPNKAGREYATERSQRLISVFGGKWTTSRTLGLKVAEVVASA